jgi:hypothetical protein
MFKFKKTQKQIVAKEIAEFVTAHNCSTGLSTWLNQYQSLEEAFADCHRGDWMIWMLGKTKKIEKEDIIKFAVACAERTLPLFEERFPSDHRPRYALVACRSWLAIQGKKPRSTPNTVVISGALESADKAYKILKTLKENFNLQAWNAAMACAFAAETVHYRLSYDGSTTEDIYGSCVSAEMAAVRSALATNDDKVELVVQSRLLREIVGNPFKN